MKKKTMLIVGAIALCLILGQFSAVAEDATATSAVTTEQSEALQEARRAYRDAKQTESLDAYEQELNSLAETGKMSREQADLLLKDAKERAALREARKAYRSAVKENSSASALEEELKAMVESGKLTQEQADLLLASGMQRGREKGGRMNRDGNRGFNERQRMNRGSDRNQDRMGRGGSDSTRGQMNDHSNRSLRFPGAMTNQ